MLPFHPMESPSSVLKRMDEGHYKRIWRIEIETVMIGIQMAAEGLAGEIQAAAVEEVIEDAATESWVSSSKKTQGSLGSCLSLPRGLSHKILFQAHQPLTINQKTPQIDHWLTLWHCRIFFPCLILLWLQCFC
tara:strand:- start:59 stop:457 length:399 start_codon:yes stop_codon:yes gene_type:complete